MPNQRDEVNRSTTSKTNVNNQKAQNAKSKQTARPWPFQLFSSYYYYYYYYY